MSVKFCNKFPRQTEENLAKCLQLFCISTPSSSLRHEFEVCVLSWSNLQKKISDLGLETRISLLPRCYRIRFYPFQDFFCALYCIVVGSRRLMPPDGLQPKAYCTNPGL